MIEYPADQLAAGQQIFIAVVVPIGVIDFLQVVGIKHQQRKFCIPHLHLPFQPFLFQFVGVLVLYMGQWIAVSLIPHTGNIFFKVLHRNVKASGQNPHFIVGGPGQLHIQIAFGDLFGSFCQRL